MLDKLRKCGRKLHGKLRKYGRKWLDQLAISSPGCMFAKLIRKGNARDEMANCLRFLNLLFIFLFLNVSNIHNILATFETANYRNCIYDYRPI